MRIQNAIKPDSLKPPTVARLARSSLLCASSQTNTLCRRPRPPERACATKRCRQKAPLHSKPMSSALRQPSVLLAATVFGHWVRKLRLGVYRDDVRKSFFGL